MSASEPRASDQGAGTFYDVVAEGTRSPRLGVVHDYDKERGIGAVPSENGVLFGFHSTQIADGSRQIAPGSAVAFRLAAAVGGRFEAFGLTATAGARGVLDGTGHGSSLRPA